MQNLTFYYLPAWKPFVAWRHIQRRRKFERIYNALSNNCLISNPVYLRLFQIVQKLFGSLDTLKFFPNNMNSPLNIVQFCAQINRNLRYNNILMLHVIKCIFIAFNYTRCTLTKLIHCKEVELNWNSKEINQTSSMTDTWKKGVIIKNNLEQLRNHLSRFPNLIHCIRYRLASFILSKFQSNIEDYICEIVNLQDKPIEETKESIIKTHNYRLVIYPVLLQQQPKDNVLESPNNKERNQLLLWPSPTSLISIFKLTFEQFKNSLHLNKILSDNQLTQIYFTEEKEIENLNEIVDNEVYANSIIHMFYSNSNLVDLDGLKHTITIPWDIVNPIGLEATNVYIHLIPKQQFHQIQSIQHGLYTDQTHLNITGHNCFPTLESISQWGLDSLIEQQCEAMNLYGCLMMPWSEIIYEKTNNIILSIEWIVNMNETVNELNTILQNEDLYTELHKYQRLFQTSVQWINSLQNHNNLLNDNRSNNLQCFILIDYSPLFNLLRNQLMEKLHKLFSIYIPIVQNSLISINNQLDDFIHTHSNIPPDFNGFIQVTTYLNHVHMCHEKLSKDHENLCRQVEKLTNRIEWARRKFFRYRKEFYLHYKKNIKETLKEVDYLVHSLTTGKYSDVNYDAQCILNDMKEPYCRLIKLETYIHQLVDQYKTVQHCEENEEAHEKSQVEKINMFNSHQAMMKTPPTLEKNDVVKSCRTDFIQTKYFNETNKDLLRMDNEMKKVNCRYDAWELKARISTFKQELFETKLGEVSLNVFNETCQKLVTICNNLQNDDIIVQYNVKCLKVMKTMIKLLSYIMDSDLLSFSSDYWIQCSNLLNLPFNMKWEHCTITDLMKDDKNNLLKQKDKLKEIWQIFHYSMFIQQMKITIENQFNSLNVQFMSMRSHTELIKSETISGRNSNRSDALTTKIYYPWIFLNIDNLLEKLCELSSKLQSLLDSELLNTTKPNEAKSSSLLLTNEKEYYFVKRLEQTKNALYNIKLTQDYWLYLYRLYSLKQFNEELSSSQFLELTDNFIQLENRLLSNDHVVTNQFIECEDNEMLQVNCLDLQSFTNVINSEWELWLTLKDSLYKNVNMFNGPIEEMCETFPLFCLLSKMERISLVCNWYIPFYDYAAPPLKCSIQDVIDTEYTSCQYYLNDITKNYGLINLNKWIKRLFPFLINCIMIWCKGENCWKITNVINEFNQSIPLLVTIKWLPSINQWFIQFYNILQLTLITITLNSMLTYKKSNKKLMNEFIQNKPLISLELTERIIIWQKLENIIRKEKRNDEFNEIIEYLEERLNNTTELLNISFNCDKQIKSRIEQLTCQFLIGTILGFIHLIQDLKKEANLNEDNFLWQQLIKTQLINSIWNHKENDELENVYNEFPMIVGSTGKGKQTLIRQLAFILGRHLLEFSPDDAFNHSNLDTFEKRLKNDILNCLRIGGLFSIMNMHTLKYGELEIVINCMDEIKKCNFMENSRNKFVGFTLDLQHAVDNINKNSHKLIIHQSNQHNSYSKQCLFNQNIRIDCVYKIFLKHKESSIDEFIQTISNQMNNYFTLSIIIKSFEFAKQFWLKTLKQLQYQRKTTPITSLIRLNNEEDKLAKMSIIYGLIKVNRINLFIDNNNNNQHNNLKNLLVHSKLIEMNWLLTIEQYLSITSTISCRDECKHYLNCTNYMYPKVSWEFIHRLFREIHLHNLAIINNQLIKIIELWQLIHFNRPILIIGPTASDDIHLTSKHAMNIFCIPDQLIAYLNEFNLILNENDSIHFNVNNNKIISLKHLFPYSNEYLINFFSQNDVNDLHIDTLNIIEEWLLLDLSDQSIDHLTFLDESNIFNLLKVVKHSRKLFIEKTTIADLSPGLIHRFSLCSIEVNDELLWSHLWDKILSELDNLIPVILDETWEFVNQSCYRDVDDDDGSTSSLLNMKSYKNAFYQQNIKNLLALISELLKIYFPKELWELLSTYQSNIAIIDYFWSEWRNFEDRSEFYEILIRNLFETIILRVLKDFIKLPVSLNIESMNNLPPSSSSPSSPTLELYYTQQINHYLNGYNCSTTSNNKWSYNKNEESGETVDIFQYSLFNCLVDLRTGYLTPFWYTDSYQLHWPEEYDIIIPGESRQYTKPLLPTLFHLSVHLFTGSLFIQSDRPMIISGPNGSGKSQLAIAISQNIEQYKVLIGSKQQQQQQHCHHHKNTRSFRIQSSEFLKRIISNSQINNHDIDITVQRHKSTSYKMNLMNKLIILEDVHLISKTLKVQRIWNQELRNQLNDHFNYSKSQSKFIPILTTLDDHHKNRTYSHFPMKLNSLMYQFAFIQLTDPCLLFSKEMNINGFLQEQNVYGFSPISLLCQLMMGHELSRISGILVERFSWIIWYMHCSLMKERCIHGSASVDWLTSQKIAYAMGYHLKKYYSYATTNEILLNCSVISNDINKHIYSRWAPLMLSESIQPNPVYQSSKVLESVLFLCQEVKRYFSPLLPKNSSTEWLFTHLSKSFEFYLMKPSPLGLLIPISYLLFGPSGSLFLNSKITRQSIVHLTVNLPMKSEDIPISTLLHSVYDSTKLPTSSISPYKSLSSISKSSSSTFTTCCTHSTAITSTTITSVSTYSDTTLSSSSQFNSKHYSSNYSTTSVNTSSYDSLVYVCSSSSLPVPSSSTHSLSNLCSIPSVTTAMTTSSTSSDNLLVTTPTLSTSTLTNQISFHENNKIVEPHTIRNHNEFTKQIETLCSKLNDEIETSLSICAQPNYSRYYNIKHKEVSYMNHQSWAKYGLLNPHLVPSNTLPGCLEVTTNLETMFVNLRNDLFMNFNVEFNYDNATLQVFNFNVNIIEHITMNIL
ncbi:Dynein heavy chain domain-containing protein [Schistosoma japonicum]|nr:Dynein heavy chain domain-containing protein [Schistosoma japonicum]